MRIYLAGYYNGKSSVYSLTEKDYPWMLESYHYINTDRHTNAIRDDKRTIFLDSGAFSAFTKGATIELEDYSRFVIKNRDLFHVVANLDDLHKNEQKTWDNQKELERMMPGVNILPTFHTREDPKWLKRYVDEYEYIAIGGMVAESKQWLRVWLDDIWDKYLTDGAGRARVKVHGFGMTNFDIANRYPWFSVDSTGWVLAGRYGLIFLPQPGNPYYKLAISDQSPKVKDWDSHFDSVSDAHRANFTREIEARGFNVEELRTIYWKRDLFNISVFKEFNDKVLDVRFKKATQSLFD